MKRKTPLTNIHMCIEMLEKGIARYTAREQDDYRLVGSESTRLPRLINLIENSIKFGRPSAIRQITIDVTIHDGHGRRS